MASPKGKELVSYLLAHLEKQEGLNPEETVEALLFVTVVFAINAKISDPTILLDKLIHKWVKVNSLLSKSFLGEQGEA